MGREWRYLGEGGWSQFQALDSRGDRVGIQGRRAGAAKKARNHGTERKAGGTDERLLRVECCADGDTKQAAPKEGSGEDSERVDNVGVALRS